jgi:hypothetical protein
MSEITIDMFEIMTSSSKEACEDMICAEEQVKSLLAIFCGYLSGAVPELHKIEAGILISHIEEFITKFDLRELKHEKA